MKPRRKETIEAIDTLITIKRLQRELEKIRNAKS
jgi:hypothetical protein